MEKPFMYTITCQQRMATHNRDEKFIMSTPCNSFLTKSELLKMVGHLSKKTASDSYIFRIYVFIENSNLGKHIEYSKIQHEFLLENGLLQVKQ